ncbi:Rieske (2Fe-2S) protein [Congregibacter sp.]|uniref:Rieske (2Fe-2S) protein n=1 Tax=Congregibacter sp. TaxID=2744308 RepID=UPI003F6BF06B
MAYRALEKLMNLHDGYRKVVTVRGRQLLLLQEGGALHLIDRHCPHQGQALDGARVDSGLLTCPKHGIQFSLRSGTASGHECAALGVHTVVYEGNTVGVDE